MDLERTSLITPPAGEPITLAEAKAHIRVTFADEDTLITQLIAGAREAFEHKFGRQLVTASWRGFLDRFPRFDREPINIAKPPLVSVTTVTYIDTSGVSQTWAAAEYTVEAFAGPFAQRGILYPKPDEEYPLTRWIPNAVTIDFDAGYGAAANVPVEIKQWLLAYVGHLYENREHVIVGETPAMVPELGMDAWNEMDFG